MPVAREVMLRIVKLLRSEVCFASVIGTLRFTAQQLHFFTWRSHTSLKREWRFRSRLLSQKVYVLVRQRLTLPPGGSCRQKRLFGTVFGD